MICIIAWVGVISLIYFLIMKKLNLLRVPLVEEIMGLDYAEMGSKVTIEVETEEGFTRKMTLGVVGTHPKFKKINNDQVTASPAGENQASANTDRALINYSP